MDIIKTLLFVTFVALVLGCVSPPEPTTTVTNPPTTIATPTTQPFTQTDVDKLSTVVASGDTSKCDELIGKGGLYNNCILTIAADTKNPTLCEKTTTVAKRDICYHEVFLKTGDKSLCSKITNPNIKSGC
jgi:hypothetical protein